MSDKNLKIDKDHAGRRIDNYLFYIYKSLPKSKIYNMIRKGEIRVNIWSNKTYIQTAAK